MITFYAESYTVKGVGGRVNSCNPPDFVINKTPRRLYFFRSGEMSSSEWNWINTCKWVQSNVFIYLNSIADILALRITSSTLSTREFSLQGALDRYIIYIIYIHCLSVCPFVSNKRQNGWAYRTKIFSGTSRDPMI